MNKKIIYSLLLLLSMSSCMKDELDGIADANNGRGTRIYVEALSHTVVETRAATSENAINDLSILVFDASDKLTEYVEASILSNGEIYATLKHATEQRKLLIMANVKAIVNKAKVADPNVFATGATLASIQDKLLLDAAMIIKDPTTGSNITTMPMLSAIITEAKIDEDTPLGTTTAPLQLTHRLTKISAESSVTDMQIESITLRQAPANGGRLLGNNTTPEIAERINYFGADDVATPLMPTSNQPLYMFSSKNTGSTVTKPVEMIVKARYGSDAVATYYHIRLDKKATDAATEKTLFDFNPGTHYKIIFTKVTTPGYPNVNEAIVNEYSNVDYLITDDSNMGEVLTNGQYMLNSSNSDCKIYGDFDPAFEYPIADLLTNAPAHTKIEITPVGSGFTVATGAADINRDGQTITKLKVKFTSQFSSGSVKVRIGNLIKIFTFSIELDPPYVKIEDVLEARIASGFESRTIALSKSPYNERIKPTDLTDKLEGLGTGEAVYIHFNKITMGDEARIGEAYFTQKSTNIHHTKVIVYQRPYVEIEGAKFSTGNIVIGYHPDGTLRYKIGAAVEYGVVFQENRDIAVGATRSYPDNWSGSQPIYTPLSSGAFNSPLTTTYNSDAMGMENAILNAPANDPCKTLTNISASAWRTPTAAELELLIKHKGGKGASASGFRTSPTGFLAKNGELFIVANGRRWPMATVVQNRDLVDVMCEIGATTEDISFEATLGSAFLYPYQNSPYKWSIRCISSPHIFEVDLKAPIKIAENMEEYYIQGISTSTITSELVGDVAGKLNVSISPASITEGVPTRVTITVKRPNIVHTGATYTGQLKLKDQHHSVHTFDASIDMSTVNIGGTFITNTANVTIGGKVISATAKSKTYSGGTYWATGNLTIQNPAQNTGMTISTDPYNMQNKDMFFKFQSRIAAYENFINTFRVYDGSGTSITVGSWAGILPVHENEDPCKNAAKIPGEAGVVGKGYWRQPTKAEAEVLVSNIPISGERIAVYNSRLGFAHTKVLYWEQNGALVWGGSNNWTSSISGIVPPDRVTGSAYSFHAGAHVMQYQNVNFGFFVRCVKN